MTKVTIVADNPGSPDTKFRASALNREAVGATVGTALDGLATQLNDSAGTLIIVQNLRPDQFFTADQQRRLEHLFEKWRSARDCGQSLPPNELAELEGLVNSELNGATNRVDAMAQELRR
jgi:hypothetical protein